MGVLTADQRTKVRVSLFQAGLTFKPLLDEMVDHVACDLEEQLSQGQSFDDALEQLINQLPKTHFQTIQRETMETIGKRFTLSRGLSLVAVGLFFVCTAFKVLHLAGADQLLLVSFGFVAAALLTGSLSGIHTYSEKKGAVRILAVIAGMILLLVAYSFKLLHLRGADQVIVASIVTTIVALLVNTLYVYQNASGEGNLLTFLHEKYTPGIERFLLLLLIPVTVYKFIAILTHADSFVGGFVLIVVIFGAGLQFIALQWRTMEKDLTRKNAFAIAMTIASFVCLTLPFLGGILSIEFRLVVIAMFSITSAWLCYYMNGSRNAVLALIVVLIPILFVAECLIRLSFLPSGLSAIFFNLPLMVFLSVLLFLAPKHSMLRSYVIISLASYVLEYPLSGMFLSN